MPRPAFLLPKAVLLSAALLSGVAAAQTTAQTVGQSTPQPASQTVDTPPAATLPVVPAPSVAAPPVTVPTAAPVSPTPSPAPSQDLTLEAALLQLSQAPSVTQARLSVEAAQANLNAARTALGLTVSVVGNGGYSASYTTKAPTTGANVTAPSTLGGVAGVDVSLGILPWSTNQYTLRSAQRNLSLAEAYLADAEHNGRLNVIQQYYNAVSAQQAVNLAQQTVALRQRALSVAQTQQNLQNATAESVLSAQANLQTAQAQLAQAQGAFQTAHLSLGAALGRDMSGYNFVSVAPTSFGNPEVEALVSRARATRSEVMYARKQLGDAQDQLEQAQRNATLPSLTAGVNYGPTASTGIGASLDLQKGTMNGSYTVPWGDSASNNSNHLTASVNGSYVVYSPALRAQLAAYRANVTQYQLSLSVAQQNVELDVRTKYNTYQNALLALQAQQTQVQVAQTALGTAQSRLQAGLATQDDVNQAQLALVSAQNTLQTDRVAAQVALVQLQNAAGGQP